MGVIFDIRLMFSHGRLVSTLDEARCKLGCLDQICSELTFDHLMLHLLQD